MQIVFCVFSVSNKSVRVVGQQLKIKRHTSQSGTNYIIAWMKSQSIPFRTLINYHVFMSLLFCSFFFFFGRAASRDGCDTAHTSHTAEVIEV